ncbi:hypothetical protein CEXT_620301 [Caerostris extrusa]|uniref:Uncharacterized protein n=1 Tax=Caerostris extrusa TaxID=172846 RepID=A0AAV4WTU4_CAEEX|nr:hypothetical protein CEXT_620301 [Caerostris extrusa]
MQISIYTLFNARPVDFLSIWSTVTKKRIHFHRKRGRNASSRISLITSSGGGGGEIWKLYRFDASVLSAEEISVASWRRKMTLVGRFKKLKDEVCFFFYFGFSVASMVGSFLGYCNQLNLSIFAFLVLWMANSKENMS